MSDFLAGSVIQINVNPAGGVPKLPVPATELTFEGVKGDKQRDRRFHGGPMRAVCLYSFERIQALQSEGHMIAPGTTGENLTVNGIDWDALQIGDCLRIGERAMIEITSYAVPCSNIAASFRDGAFKRMSQKVHAGWSRVYARVLVEGPVRQGDSVRYELASV